MFGFSNSFNLTLELQLARINNFFVAELAHTTFYVHQIYQILDIEKKVVGAQTVLTSKITYFCQLLLVEYFMVKIIDGKKLAEKIKDKIVKEIVKLNGGRPENCLVRPNLAIILVGEREDSKIYVGRKEQAAKEVGIDTHLYKCAEHISEAELLEVIKCLNEDKSIDAILVQLPLPEKIDADTIIMAVDPIKDVDGFHPDNLEVLLKSCEFDALMPPVFAAVLEILASIDYQLEDKQVCIIANSLIFGQGLAHVLRCRGAKPEAIKIEAKKLAEKINQADVLITAVGKPKFIKREMIKKDAVIIDIGITKQGKDVWGDVDFEAVKDRAGYITPVPGGVGPMTIALALKNTLEIYKRRHKE